MRRFRRHFRFLVGCSAKRERGTCSSSVGIKASELEDRVLTGLKDILLDQDDLIDTFVNGFNAELESLRCERGTRDRQLQKKLNKVNAANARCLAFITGGDGDPGLVRDELKALEIRKIKLEQSLAADTDNRAIEAHPNLANLYARKVGDLRSLLADEATRAQAVDIIRSQVDHIAVREDAERGKSDVVRIRPVKGVDQTG
jgi:site-specific DNA recombinase